MILANNQNISKITLVLMYVLKDTIKTTLVFVANLVMHIVILVLHQPTPNVSIVTRDITYSLNPPLQLVRIHAQTASTKTKPTESVPLVTIHARPATPKVTILVLLATLQILYTMANAYLNVLTTIIVMKTDVMNAATYVTNVLQHNAMNVPLAQMELI